MKCHFEMNFDSSRQVCGLIKHDCESNLGKQLAQLLLGSGNQQTKRNVELCCSCPRKHLTKYSLYVKLGVSILLTLCSKSNQRLRYVAAICWNTAPKRHRVDPQTKQTISKNKISNTFLAKTVEKARSRTPRSRAAAFIAPVRAKWIHRKLAGQ